MADERMVPGDADLVVVGEYVMPLEAEWARSVLASAGICCLIPDTAMSYIYPFTGLVRVQVPASREAEARALLDEMDFERGLFLEAKARGEVEEAEPGPPPEPSDDGTAIDPHELCPTPPALLCPSCGSGEADPCPAPAYSTDSAAGAFLKRILGHGWMRCGACGHVWER